jgi:hypothetical protein
MPGLTSSQPLQAQGEPRGNADQGRGDGLSPDEDRREVSGIAAGLRLSRAPPPPGGGALAGLAANR